MLKQKEQKYGSLGTFCGLRPLNLNKFEPFKNTVLFAWPDKAHKVSRQNLKVTEHIEPYGH